MTIDIDVLNKINRKRTRKVPKGHKAEFAKFAYRPYGHLSDSISATSVEDIGILFENATEQFGAGMSLTEFIEAKLEELGSPKLLDVNVSMEVLNHTVTPGNCLCDGYCWCDSDTITFTNSGSFNVTLKYAAPLTETELEAEAKRQARIEREKLKKERAAEAARKKQEERERKQFERLKAKYDN